MLQKPQSQHVSSWRQYKEYDSHEFVIGLSDAKSGLRAYIAVHNTNRGAALGGTRMSGYASEDAALKDVLNLSKAMSYKCALANLPYGGGKGVIIADDKLNREQVLLGYARLVEKLRGLFKTGTDVGVSDEDVRAMASQTTHMLGVTAADRGNLSTSNTAALGVFYAMKAALPHLGAGDFNSRTVAIKGIGKLGGELARLILKAGGKVVVADIDPKKCQELQKRYPAAQIAPVEAIHTHKVDIYAPCALGNEFFDDTVTQLQCRAVVGGANNQLANAAVGETLHKRGILYAPDYIANAGGLIYVADELEPGGFKKERVIERTQAIEQTMSAIFTQAEAKGLPTNKVADQLALERIQDHSNA